MRCPLCNEPALTALCWVPEDSSIPVAVAGDFDQPPPAEPAQLLFCCHCAEYMHPPNGFFLCLSEITPGSFYFGKHNSALTYDEYPTDVTFEKVMGVTSAVEFTNEFPIQASFENYCPRCEGDGFILCDLDRAHRCNACDGSGTLPEEEAPIL